MGLVIHVINHTARRRSLQLSIEEREDLCGHVFLEIVKNDFALLRHFRRQSSLATYLSVVARRIVVSQMLKLKSLTPLGDAVAKQPDNNNHKPEKRISDREEVDRLLEELNGAEAQVVRMFHLDGKSYQEISAALEIPENTIGPMLSRARSKMRQAAHSPEPAGEPE